MAGFAVLCIRTADAEEVDAVAGIATAAILSANKIINNVCVARN
jgi:hypothetical protein